jgi:hypothetical protein
MGKFLLCSCVLCIAMTGDNVEERSVGALPHWSAAKPFISGTTTLLRKA